MSHSRPITLLVKSREVSMGKLTAEQTVREYNRGQKAASEGRSRSWSEPWAYPFESGQHYERAPRGVQPGLWNNRRHAPVYPAISSTIMVKPATVQTPNLERFFSCPIGGHDGVKIYR